MRIREIVHEFAIELKEWFIEANSIYLLKTTYFTYITTSHVTLRHA